MNKKYRNAMKQKRSKDVEQADWHSRDEDDPTVPSTFKKLPKRYEVGFLAKLDKRTEVFALLKTSFDEITSDMGGVESLSHTQVCLAERFTFLEFVLRGIEQKIAENPKSSEVAIILSRWVQGLNSLMGLARVIGLERRARKITNLKMYVKEREQ